MGGIVLQQRLSELDASRLSVVIITLNEEKNLRRCLQSLPQGSEVFILDSGSTDRTEEIAREAGANFEFRGFTDYADQKNHANNLATRDWVLSLDADEELDAELRDAITRVVNDVSDHCAYRIPRQLVFMDRKMRFGKTNDAPIRLFRQGTGKFMSAIHESLQVDGEVKSLSGKLFHYSYDDLTDYFTRFNNYTSRIALNHKDNGKRPPSRLVSGLRFWIEFKLRYIFRLGFLDGYPGYIYALLSSFYVVMKYEKLRELTDS